MISVDFTQLNESLKTFILSVSVGSEVVIDSLINTANRHIAQLEVLQDDTMNVKLHFECSVSIINQAYNSLCYINLHAADFMSDSPLCPLDSEIESIGNRFSLALERIKKEVSVVYG